MEVKQRGYFQNHYGKLHLSRQIKACSKLATFSGIVIESTTHQISDKQRLKSCSNLKSQSILKHSKFIISRNLLSSSKFCI